MSKMLEYVGFLHLLKDRVREGWSQFWERSGSEEGQEGAGGGEGVSTERETNFRKRVREKLDRLKEQTIRKINHSDQDQEDFTHIYR
jgi:hypothetical protein